MALKPNHMSKYESNYRYALNILIGLFLVVTISFAAGLEYLGGSQVVSILFLAIVLAIFFRNWEAPVGFLLGAVLSGAAGFIGMKISVQANVRTTEAASKSLASRVNSSWAVSVGNASSS